MDGWTRLRILTIVAVTLISVYVLAPTVVKIIDSEAHTAAKLAEVDTPQGEANAMLVPLRVESGDPTELVAQIEARLEAMGVPHDRVTVEDFTGELSVLLALGGHADEVAAALALDHTVEVLDLRNADDPLAEPVPVEITAILPDGELGARLTLAITAAEEEVSAPVQVSLDGTVLETVEVLFEAEGDEQTITVVLGDARDDILHAHATPIDGAVSVLVAEVAVETEEEVEEVVESVVPSWLTSVLPDTAMNLGLDLQGGIDLTLQVELDEAVLSKVARDLSYFKESAARENIEVTEVKRDRVEPLILIRTPAELSEIQGFVNKRMPAYFYLDTREDELGSVHVFHLRDEEIKRVQDQAVEQVLETLRSRVDETGVKEPSIVKKGGGRINVQLPGEVDLEAAVDAIGTTAVLEFRLVDEEFDEADLQRMVAAARDALPENQFSEDEFINEWLWTTGRLSEDRMVQWEYAEVVDEEGTTGLERDYPIPLKTEIILTGDDVNDASVNWDNNQQPYVALEFKPQGANIFCRVTGENVNKRFAIILDGKIRSAPNIRERICGGRASIEMGASMDAMQDANNLALVLRTGSLNAPVSVGEVRQIGPSLGKDAIQSGSIATLIGGFVVFIFMAVWYRTAGLVADIALGINLLLVMAMLAMFGATLTLPGFAGLALTIGMAVDANIIIYERIREELRLGQSPRKAVDVGFDKATVAVLDANITTAIAGVVLFSYGTGPIKGFAVTLLIGIATTLFTALFVARTIMELITRSSTARLRI